MEMNEKSLILWDYSNMHMVHYHSHLNTVILFSASVKRGISNNPGERREAEEGCDQEKIS